MALRVFSTCDIGEEALARLHKQGFTVDVYPHIEPPPHEFLVEKAGQVDALITTLRDRVDEAVFAAGAAGTLKVVAQIAVGVDNIDCAAANLHRIPFSHTAEVLTGATAEYAFFLLGAVARRLFPAEELVREQRWTTWHPSHPFLGDEVSGKTLAVIGLGRIGRSVVNKAMGFDMDILCHDPTQRATGFVGSIRRLMELRHQEGLAPRAQTIALVSLEEALAQADFVTLHVGLTRPGESARPTFHLIDAERLRLMKPTAYLVNTSRGPVVDEAALADALLAGRLAGAALDVYEQEPLPADSPLRDARLRERLRLLPHFASATRETRLSPDPDVGMAGRTVQAVIDILGGADPASQPYVVNKEAFRP